MEELIKSWEERLEAIRKDWKNCTAKSTKANLAGQGAELKKCIDELKALTNK